VSLRRRITAAAALAVAAVALLLAGAGYLSTRSELVSQVRNELQQRVEVVVQLAEHRPHPRAGRHRGRGLGLRFLRVRPPQPLGGAPGYFQFVRSDGMVIAAGGVPELPVTADVRAVAERGHGSFFSAAVVSGTHVEMLTRGISAPFTGAIQAALPLTDADHALHDLLVRYLILVGVGVLLAGALAMWIARAAIAPIVRFTTETERVTGALDHPHRLEASGAEELTRLAASFNQTLDALERSIVAQQHLIADASHELRTPIAALRSNIEIFLDSDRLPAGEREELQRAIIAELDDLTQLASDVLELARGSGPADHTEQVELDEVVREVVARTQRRAPLLSVTLDIEPTVVVAAPDRVARAVTNVLDNARKWSAADGFVEVTLRDGVLSVRDLGPGFEPADLDHVFDRFYRAGGARPMPGSGLGLAIVKQAAEAHGGFAQAANAADGGAVVRVSFGPAVRAAGGLSLTGNGGDEVVGLGR